MGQENSPDCRPNLKRAIEADNNDYFYELLNVLLKKFQRTWLCKATWRWWKCDNFDLLMTLFWWLKVVNNIPYTHNICWKCMSFKVCISIFKLQNLQITSGWFYSLQPTSLLAKCNQKFCCFEFRCLQFDNSLYFSDHFCKVLYIIIKKNGCLCVNPMFVHYTHHQDSVVWLVQLSFSQGDFWRPMAPIEFSIIVTSSGFQRKPMDVVDY